MVSVMTTALAFTFGLFFYILVPVLGQAYPIEYRTRIGRQYLKWGVIAIGQFAFVRRILSGLDVLEIDVDDEQKILNVTLSSSTIGDDNLFGFTDPDNRVKRLFNRPVAVAYEVVPANLSPELAELAHHYREHDIENGAVRGTESDTEPDIADPWVETTDGLCVIDPKDILELVPNSVDPENLKTAAELTRQRYSMYGNRINLETTLAVVIGFVAGVGGIAGLQYVQQNLLESGGAGKPDLSVGLGMIMVDGIMVIV